MKKIIRRDESASGANRVNLRSMEGEVKRKGGELSVAAMQVAERTAPADALRMQVALMMGAWQSELSTKLDGVLQQIERNAEPDDHWEILRRQIATAKPEAERYVTASISSLTKTEAKIFLLAGMSVPPQKIAEILNISLGSLTQHLSRIHGKLNLAPETKLDELFGAMLR